MELFKYKYHNGLEHVGVNKVLEVVLKTYWLPKLKEKIGQHIKNCLDCIEFTAKGKHGGLLHNIQKKIKPFEQIHIDHLGPVTTKDKKSRHILVIVDGYTKFVRLVSDNRTGKLLQII